MLLEVHKARVTLKYFFIYLDVFFFYQVISLRPEYFQMDYFFWRNNMSKICEITGKKPKMGRSIIRRGIAKKKKGIQVPHTQKPLQK